MTRRIEFGSDFDKCRYPVSEEGTSFFNGKNLYASGRQALQHLIQEVGGKQGWTRLWVPAYYCGESLEYIHGIEIKRYSILPYETPCYEKLNDICQFQEGDVLMLVNFFGMHARVDVSDWNVTVIEDHTHDIASEWALNSTADWCFASIRKQLPVADGGILWSPKENKLPSAVQSSSVYQDISDRRNQAMQLKSLYLNDGDVDKTEFLSLFAETEEVFATMPLISPCQETVQTALEIDLNAWRELKARNLKHIKSLLKPTQCEIIDSATFSLILKFADKTTRDAVRKELIANCVYGAVLWPDVYAPNENTPERVWADCMLSLHVDGRYSIEDMEILAEILNKVI